MPKQEVMFPTPAAGMRKDVDNLVQTEDMGREGKNVIYYDGVLRPRPAMTKQTSDPDSGEGFDYPKFSLIADTADLDGYNVWSVIDLANGILLGNMHQSSTYNWYMSVDNGQSWYGSDSAVEEPGFSIFHMRLIGTRLFAFGWERVAYADISTLPATLTWTEVTMPGGAAGVDQDGRLIYDSANDAFICLSTYGSIAYTMGVTVIYDATGTPTADDLAVPQVEGPPYKYGVGGWNGSHLSWITFNFDGGPMSWSIRTTPLAWNSSTGEYDFGSVVDEDEQEIYEIYNTDGSVNLIDLHVIHLTAPTDYLTIQIAGPVECNDAGRFVMATHSTINVIEDMNHIFSYVVNDDGTITQSSIEKIWRLPDAEHSISDFDRSPEQISIAVQDNSRGFTDGKPIVFTSTDNGKTWMRFEPEDDVTEYTFDVDTFMDSSNERHFFIGRTTGVGSEIYQMPSGSGGSFFGDLCGMIQTDLSDEDKAVIIGGTSGIYRLDKDDNEWVRITATDTESVGTAEWLDPGDVPPLSGTSDSGVNIAGTYGEHPWVFRTFVAQGDTFIVGVNGQCDPIIYHPEMEDDFARRVGYVPGSNDPNWNADADSPYGDPPPRARCMVSSADRLVFANNPAGSPFALYVSDPLDPDRGWLQGNDNQEVLLADTPGGIVTMEEISALQFAIYKEDAIYHGISQVTFGFGDSAVAAPFRFELSKAGISGPCSPASVLRNFDGRQIYLARDGGVYMYDGVAPIDGGRNIRRLIQNEINLDELGKVWGVVDNRRKLVWFFYPSSGGSVNKGIVISTDQGYPWPCWKIALPEGWTFSSGMEIRLEDDITIGDIGTFESYGDDVTLSSFASGQRLMLMGLKNGTFFAHNWDNSVGDYNDGGLPIEVAYRSGWLTPGGVNIYTADDLYHIFSSPDASQELEVRLHAQQIGSNIRVRGPRTLSSSKLRRSTRHRVSGSQFSVDLRGAINSPFAWGGAVMRVTKRGNR